MSSTSVVRSLDVLVVGGGIAGASAAYALATTLGHRVGLVEAEPTLAHHTTGRSAAQLIENYGAQANRALTGASLEFLANPPDDLVDGPILTTRGILTVAPEGRGEQLAREVAAGRALNPTITEIDIDTALALVPVLRPERIVRAMWEPQSADIDVAGLHQAFVRGLRAAGGSIATATRLDSARPDGEGWRVETTEGDLLAGHIVDAAGAWGDVVARGCGVRPVGLVPKRRTAFMVASDRAGSAEWPLFGDVDHNWYVKPDGPQFLCSPADTTPSEPLDAKPEEIDVAIGIDRINTATTLDIRSVASSWAGLRTFAPDEAMVIGPDPDRPNFHWCVGQGGTGIQTSPGAGRLVADLLVEGSPGSWFAGRTIDVDGLSAGRFR